MLAGRDRLKWALMRCQWRRFANDRFERVHCCKNASLPLHAKLTSEAVQMRPRLLAVARPNQVWVERSLRLLQDYLSLSVFSCTTLPLCYWMSCCTLRTRIMHQFAQELPLELCCCNGRCISTAQMLPCPASSIPPGLA